MLLTLLLGALAAPPLDGAAPIDREALVHRHNPVVEAPGPLSPLTVGNSSLAFTAGITGLQTFPAAYADGIPLATQSWWGWHAIPSPEPFTLDDAMKFYDTYGRQVGYASQLGTPAANWLRANPHRLHLGRIGLVLTLPDGREATIDDLAAPHQELDLWTGLLRSSFSVAGTPVLVETACHGERDILGVRITSPLVAASRLAVRFEFPYGSENWGPDMADWGHPDRHTTTLEMVSPKRADLHRKLDQDRYEVSIGWSGEASLRETAPHHFILQPRSGDAFGFVCAFQKEAPIDPLPDAAEVQAAAAGFWRRYWSEGAAVDLSESTDPRAAELERRIVLSQYLVAINCAAPFPPQETGLTCNSWYGKPHLEMHWWHSAQFALWGRAHLLEKSMAWYQEILPMARATADSQGYRGARWPKMVGPDGREGPSSIAVFLIWQQPHPIYYAELLYREHQDAGTLNKYKDLVFESAEFMASYAHWDESSQRYVLGPPLIPAQEMHRADSTMNPTFELAYWAYALEVAQQWRERLGLSRNEAWEQVRRALAALPTKDGLYVNAESAPDTFGAAGPRADHPSLLAAYGMLPGPGVDPEMMRRTLLKVLDTWQWPTTWGWDYPLIAMTAARVGETERAIDALLMDSPKNHHLPNGHNYQGKNLPLYLPGNGGLLAAIAMMARGWDGAPGGPAPGFPHNGAWTVRAEGFRPMP